MVLRNRHSNSKAREEPAGMAQEKRHSSKQSWKKLEREKRKLVELAIGDADVEALATMCMTQFGLVDSELRMRAWMLLLERNDFSELVERPGRSRRERVEIEHEFRMDLDRSMYHHSCCKALSKKRRYARRAELNDIICHVLHADPSLYYFQGFHDICTVVLHVFSDDVETGKSCATLLSRQYFADHHRPDFSHTIKVMDLIPVLLQHFDPKVYDVLQRAQVGPMFALPWMLTGFSHSVLDINVIYRIFDAIVAAHPLLCVYLCAAIILRPHTRRRLLKLADKDMATIHHFLQNVPPPCIVSGSGALKRRSKRRSRLRKAQIQNADGLAETMAYIPSAKEDLENDVEKLIEKGLEMMCELNPAQLLEQAKPAVEIPPASIAHIKPTQKHFWITATEHIRANMAHQKRAKRSYYFALATAVGFAAYFWVSNQLQQEQGLLNM